MSQAIDDVLRPAKFEGPAPTPDNFAQAFPEIVAAYTQPKKGIRPLDPESQRNLEELRRELRANPPRPATVVNLHPWPLSFPSTQMFTRGILVPACNPGQDFAHHYIRTSSIDKKYNEDCTGFQFFSIKPIHKAGQFLRMFADPEVYGGGVIIYEGEVNPAKMKQVELYQPDGSPMVSQESGFEEDDEGNRVPIVRPAPIYGDLQEMLIAQRRRRNEFYLNKVEWADEQFKSTNVSARRLITPMHRLMAEVLYAEGIIPSVPEWNLPSQLEKGMSHNTCVCGELVKQGVVKCGNCGHIIDPLEAYKRGVIEYDHVSMDTLTADQWAEADEVHETRGKAKKEAAARRKEAKKANPEQN